MSTTGLLNQLPELDSIADVRGLVENGLGDILTQVAEAPESLLAPLGQSLSSLTDGLPDLNALLEPLTEQQGQLKAQLPESVSDQLGTITPLFEAAQEVIDTGPLTTILEDLHAGRSLNEIAQGGLSYFAEQLLEQIPGVAGNAMSGDLIAAADAFLAAAQGASGGSPEQIGDFLAEHMLGLPVDALTGLGSVQAPVLSALEAMSTVAGQELTAAETALVDALDAATAQLNALDPAQASGWQGVEAGLATVVSRLNALSGLLSGAPATVYGGLGQLNLTQYKNQLAGALESLSAAVAGQTASGTFTSLESIAGEIIAPLDDLATQLESLTPDAFATLLEESLGKLLTMLDGLAEQVQDNPVMSFFDDLQQVADAIGTALNSVQSAIDTAISAVVNVVDAVIDEFNQVRESVTAALQTAADALEQFDIAALTQLVSDAFAQLTALLDAVPVQQLSDQLNQAFDVLDTLVVTLNEATQTGLDELESLLGGLNNINLADAAAPVIDGIRQVTQVLSAIDPDLLPDSLKTALKEAIDAFEAQFDGDFQGYFQREIVDTLNRLFTEATAGIRDLVEGLQTKLNQFAERVRDFDPAALLRPVTDLFEQLQNALAGISSEALLAPVRDIMDQIITAVQSLSPAQLLAPLVDTFEQEVLAPLRQFQPSELFQPLTDAFAPLGEMLGALDFTDAIGGMSESATGFLSSTASSLTGAVDFSGIPGGESIAGQVSPVLELFDPTKSLDDWTGVMGDLLNNYRPGRLLEPIQTALGPVEAALDSASDETLQSIFGRLKVLGQATGTLTIPAGANPFSARLETVAQDLETIVPAAMTTRLAPAYENLQQALVQIETTAIPQSLLAQYEAVQGAVESANPATFLASLNDTLQELPLRVRRVADEALDLSTLQQAFASLLGNIGGLLPGFLAGELTPDTIRQELAQFSPTQLIGLVDEAFDRFLDRAQQFGPAIQAAVEKFINDLDSRVTSLSPAAIFDRFNTLFQPIRDVLAASPQAIADALQGAYDQLLEKIGQIHPELIVSSVQSLFDTLLGKVESIRDELLSVLGTAVDEALAQLKATVAALNPKALIVGLENLFQLLSETLANLSVADLLAKLTAAFERLRDDLATTITRSSTAFDDLVEAIPV